MVQHISGQASKLYRHYNTYYQLLTIREIKQNSLKILIPHFPQQKDSQFLLGASKPTNKDLNSAIDIILPAKYLDVAKLILTQKGETGKIVA